MAKGYSGFPRISVPVHPETKLALEGLAASMGLSAGKLAGQFLDSSQPQFSHLAALMQTVFGGEGSIGRQEALQATLEGVLRELGQQEAPGASERRSA